MQLVPGLSPGGAGNLATCLAAHVWLCLLPACVIAGAMSALMPKPAITRWLGRSAPRHVSYPVAAAAGSLLAVEIPLSFADAWQARLLDWVPFDPARGEEGVSVQGSLLIAPRQRPSRGVRGAHVRPDPGGGPRGAHVPRPRDATPAPCSPA